MLSHKSAVIRKACTAYNQIPRSFKRIISSKGDYFESPPMLANSFAKSGTYLLVQLLQGISLGRRYGNHLSTVKTSLYHRRLPTPRLVRGLSGMVPGEVMPAHLFWDKRVVSAFERVNCLHYFIIRDPRNIILSEVDYLTNMAKWHVNHHLFNSQLKNDNERITAVIKGINPQTGKRIGLSFGDRIKEYEGWFAEKDICIVKFENLISPVSFDEQISSIVNYYNTKASNDLDHNDSLIGARKALAPEKSHTYSGVKERTWQGRMKNEHLDCLYSDLGDLLNMYE